MGKINLTIEQIKKLMLEYPTFKAEIPLNDSDIRDIIFYENNTLRYMSPKRGILSNWGFKWEGITFNQLIS